MDDIQEGAAEEHLHMYEPDIVSEAQISKNKAKNRHRASTAPKLHTESKEHSKQESQTLVEPITDQTKEIQRANKVSGPNLSRRIQTNVHTDDRALCEIELSSQDNIQNDYPLSVPGHAERENEVQKSENPQESISENSQERMPVSADEETLELGDLRQQVDSINLNEQEVSERNSNAGIKSFTSPAIEKVFSQNSCKEREFLKNLNSPIQSGPVTEGSKTLVDLKPIREESETTSDALEESVNDREQNSRTENAFRPIFPDSSIQDSKKLQSPPQLNQKEALEVEGDQQTQILGKLMPKGNPKEEVNEEAQEINDRSSETKEHKHPEERKKEVWGHSEEGSGLKSILGSALSQKSPTPGKLFDDKDQNAGSELQPPISLSTTPSESLLVAKNEVEYESELEENNHDIGLKQDCSAAPENNSISIEGKDFVSST